MTASTRIVIPTKSAVTIDASSPRATIKDVASLLSGASAGVGQGKGAVLEADATVATDTGVANPGGTSLAGGVVWVSSVDSTNAPELQLGAPADTATLAAPSGFPSALEYMNTAVIAVLRDDAEQIRQNLDVGFGDTPLVYTQVAAAVQMDISLTGGLTSGDKVVVCGVEFTASTTDYSAVDKFNINASPGDADRWENKVGNHPALCGKIIATQDEPSSVLYFGSLTAQPPFAFSFQLVTEGIQVLNVTPGWVDGGGGQVDPVFGTPLVMFFDSNETQFEAGWGFSFDAADNGGLAPISDPLSPSISGFNGTATDNPPVVTSVLRGAVTSPAPAHSLHVEITQKAATSHYIQTAPMSQLFRAGDSRSVTQEVVRLLESCLSGTGISREIDTITVTAYASSTPGDSLTWTVGSR